MARRIALLVILVSVSLVAGCIGQSSAAAPSLSVRASLEPSQIRAQESASLFVDVANSGNVELPKIFIEAFDTGPLTATRVGNAVIGTLPIKAGVREVQIGGNVSRITTSISCLRAADCPDEEFGGCGACTLEAGQETGQCAPSPRSGGTGSPCEKQCECGQGLACKFDTITRMRLCLPAPKCPDGSLGNTCTGLGSYCSPWGVQLRACAGQDGFPSYVWSQASGISPSPDDDCGCPGNGICRGDGTCGAPADCYVTIYGLKPGELQTLECVLNVTRPASLLGATTPTSVAIRAQFRARLSGTATPSVLSAEEWRRRQTIGTLAAEPQSYTFSDGNVKAVLSFVAQSPFVSGDRTIATLSIQSTGSGSVASLLPSDILVSQLGNAMNCQLDTPLRSERGVFPPITCMFDAPQVDVAATYPITVTVYYDYEIRQSVPLTILKT